MAANYRRRAETATTAEQRTRHRSLAEYCEQLAMALRPRGLATRCADALRRCARAAKARTGRSWQGEGVREGRECRPLSMKKRRFLDERPRKIIGPC
jgi:hypothetical protein